MNLAEHRQALHEAAKLARDALADELAENGESAERSQDQLVKLWSLALRLADET